MKQSDKISFGQAFLCETECHSLTWTRLFIEQSGRDLWGHATSV